MTNTIYLALDVHARHCVLGRMDSRGRFLGEERFPTSEGQLIAHIVNVQSRRKRLSLEEGSLAYWVSQVLTPYVDEIVICDPRENRLISTNLRKRDALDVCSLCRLHRLGELKRVYHPQDDERAVFKSAVQHYQSLVEDQTAIKLQIKAKYRTWGVIEVEGSKPYSPIHRGRYLAQVKPVPVRHQLERLYQRLDVSVGAMHSALAEMRALGRSYPEIEQFEKMPGVGPVGAHVFDSYIQTPERFATKRQLWRYCQLSITDRSSDGKPLGFRRLDRTGVSALKAMSFHAWQASVAQGTPNEISSFFKRSLLQTHNSTHARLNTQRKILAVLWTIWKRKEQYRKEEFFRPTITD
jgi:transposase